MLLIGLALPGIAQRRTTTAAAVDCSAYIELKEDRMTGRSNWVCVDPLILTNDNGHLLGIHLSTMNRMGMSLIRLGLVPKGASDCIDDSSIAFILFRDGHRITLRNQADFNCDANFAVYINRSARSRRDLLNRQIESIRVMTMRGSVEVDLSSEESAMLMNIFNCLAQK